ncbi:RHS repeat-associated core domain-containing protein [Dysgonomonas sp. 521]|uniref:RHS repeat domain-containing protein n=1 Tax=Dysgonomonas sp. 521 TaxID=2302932 RepID=UPI0013D1D843|nr:RHS repeat-associated core domain-containing protein [Dysgonomonas sp. 521]NDV97150.1 RHS repeat-associated core domain-containing protein [Dysgonomonas sp. 521]
MTDHLGNNRVVANASGTLVQKNHYYPFGSVFASTTGAGKQPYKYNGKELDAMHGLNLYDYSARYMDSQIGRFTSVDPLAEKYPHISPYIYVENNPLRYIDPTGREKLNGMGTRNGGLGIARARDNVDNGMIHIYGHGSPDGLTFVDIRGNVSMIKNASDLQSLLTRYSAIWNNRLPGEELIIVLHSCNTGSIMDRGAITLAENISVNMPNVVIVAPSDYLFISKDGEIITSEDQTRKGSWIYYREGIPIYSEEGVEINNPDLKHYNRPLYSKGNTKEEQRAKRDEGLNQGQQKPKNYDNWSKTKQWFYDTFGIN